MEDFLMLNDLLSSEEKLVKSSVKRFVANLGNIFLEANEAAYFPQEIIPEIAQLGLLGMNLPEEFGGSNANYISYGLACQELERADSALRSFVSFRIPYVCFRFINMVLKNKKNNIFPLWLLVK